MFMKITPALLACFSLGLGTLATYPVVAAEFDASGYTITRGRTLEDFFTAAINYSPALKAARERWNIGSARVDRANGQLLPQVQVGAVLSKNEYQTDLIDRNYSGERYSFSVSQVLFNWQAFSARKMAYLTADQREAEYYAQLAEVLTIIADQYLGVLQAQDAANSIRSEIAALTTQIDRIQALFDLQLARVTDLYEAQARLAAAQAQQVELDGNVEITREMLKAATGIEVGELSRLPAEITVPPLEGTLPEWLQRTTENNKVIEARRQALGVARSQVSQARGAYMPTVSLVYQKQQSDTGFDNIQQPPYETGFLGVNVTMPLFAGGSNRATVREAFSLRNIAESEYQQAELDVLDRARTAYFRVKTGESRIESAKVLLDSTTTSLEAMRQGFEFGTVTSVDVLNALRDQFSAERDLQRVRYDHIRSHLVLRRESGSLSAEDMMEVSAMLSVAGLPSR